MGALGSQEKKPEVFHTTEDPMLRFQGAVWGSNMAFPCGAEGAGVGKGALGGDGYCMGGNRA